MKDKTADEAIRNADIELKARRIMSQILALIKHGGFSCDSDLILFHSGTNKRYIRKVVKTQQVKAKPKTFAEFVNEMCKK